jgi:hypothetical protein
MAINGFAHMINHDKRRVGGISVTRNSHRKVKTIRMEQWKARGVPSLDGCCP